MNTQSPGPQQDEQRGPKHRFLFLCLLLLISASALIWLLDSEGMLTGFWSPLLGPLFTILGVMVALLQWYAQARSAPTTPTIDVPHRPEIHLYGRSIHLGITRQKGALLVYTHKKLRGTTIYLSRGFERGHLPITAATTVGERILSGQRVYLAIFPALEPGNYTIALDTRGRRARITVYAGQLAEVDWR